MENATGMLDLDDLRGIARRLPWAGTGLLVGSLTLAGLPLTAGFASEWLVLESLMQQFRVDNLPLQLACALVALTIGVAGVAFVRLVGLTVFGHPSTYVRAPGFDRSWGSRLGIGVLSFACLGVAAVTPLLVDVLAAGLRPLVGTGADGALASPWVIQPVFADFSALSPTWLWIMMPALAALAVLLAILFSGSRLWRVRRVPAWTSASPGVDRGIGYTSFVYANPMRRVLANVLLTRSQLDELTREQHRVPALAGIRRRPPASTAAPDRPEAAQDTEASLRYRVDVVEVVEQYVYRSLGGALLAASRVARRLQSGRLDAYMLLAVMTVLAIVAVTS